MTYSQAIETLYAIAPPFHMLGAKAYKPGLETMHRLLFALGEPHLRLRCIHVAGTNGKGSTAHLVTAALAAAGMRVGLYTSPHLVDFTERIRIVSDTIRYIPQDYVASFVGRHAALVRELQPSFFEITTAMAFTWLAEQQVDIAVIEVGLGGLLDATNVITPLVSVITNIGLDHTDLLGHTLADIASQKSGIIKPSVPCVVGETHPDTEPVFAAVAAGVGAPLVMADQCEYLRRQRKRFAPACDLTGAYQEQNLQTAFVALRALASTADPVVVPHSAIALGFAHAAASTGLHGRWEVLAAKPLTICDTGHNAHGIATYIHQLTQTTNHKPQTATLRIIFGMVADKDIDDVLPLLPAHAVYYFTQPASHRALPAQEMLARWHALHPGSDARAYDNAQDALRAAREEADHDCDTIFIGGSNYLVGEILKTTQS